MTPPLQYYTEEHVRGCQLLGTFYKHRVSLLALCACVSPVLAPCCWGKGRERQMTQELTSTPLTRFQLL